MNFRKLLLLGVFVPAFTYAQDKKLPEQTPISVNVLEQTKQKKEQEKELLEAELEKKYKADSTRKEAKKKEALSSIQLTASQKSAFSTFQELKGLEKTLLKKRAEEKVTFKGSNEEKELPFTLTESFISHLPEKRQKTFNLQRSQWVKKEALVGTDNKENEKEFDSNINTKISEEQLLVQSRKELKDLLSNGRVMSEDPTLSLRNDSTLIYEYDLNGDSVLVGRKLRSYDQNDFIETYTTQDLTSSNTWETVEFVEIERSENNYITNQKTYDFPNGEKTLLLERSYTWDSDFSYTLVYEERDNNTGEMMPISKVEIEFDEEWRDLSYKSINYNEKVNAYVGWGYAYNVEYDEDGNQVFYQRLDYSKVLDEWFVWYEEETEIDGNTFTTVRKERDYYKNGFYKELTLDQKRVFEYNEDGRYLSEVIYNWNHSIEDWVGETKKNYEYDYQGNITSEIFYKWVPSKMDFVVEYKYEDLFEEGFKTERTRYDFVNDDFVADWKRTYAFDELGRQILNAYQEYNVEVEKWEKVSKVINEYDENDFITLMEDYYGETEDGEWSKNVKNHRMYDSNGNVLSFEYYRANDNVWEKASKYTSTYDLRDRMISMITYGVVNDEWVNTNQTLNTFHEDGREETIEEEWINNAWVGYSKKIIKKDEQNRLTLSEDYLVVDEGWEKSTTKTMSYHEDGKVWVEKVTAHIEGYSSYREENVYHRNSSYSKTLEMFQSGGIDDTYTYGYKYEKEFNHPHYSYSITTSKNYDWVEDAWVQNYESIESFNDEGLLVTNHYLRNMDSETSIYGTKYEYNYDNNGNIIKQQTFNWNRTTDEWLNNSVYEYAYNDNNFIIVYIYFSNWDGEKYTYGYKREYEKSDENQLLTQEFFSWSDANWVKMNKRYYSYNDLGQKKSEIQMLWDSVENDYVNNYKEEWNFTNSTDYSYETFNFSENEWVSDSYQEYQEIGNITEYITFASNKAEVINSIRRETYTDNKHNYTLKEEYVDFVYPSNSQMSLYEKHFDERVSSEWEFYGLKYNSEAGYWSNSSYKVIEDSVDNVLKSRIYYKNTGSYSNPEWELYEKFEYTFVDGIQMGVMTYSLDINGNFVEEDNYLKTKTDDTTTDDIEQSWNGSEWVNQRRQEEFFNEDGDKIGYARYDWSSDKGDWVGYYKSIDYTLYHDNGIRKYYNYESYNWENDQWVGSYAYDYSYDEEGNIISNISYRYDINKNEWFGYNKEEYSIEGDKNVTINSYWSYDISDWEYYRKNLSQTSSNTQGVMTKNVLEVESWNPETENWFGVEREITHYTENSSIFERYVYLKQIDLWEGAYRTEIFKDQSIIIRYSWIEDEDWIPYQRETNIEEINIDGSRYTEYLYEDYIDEEWKKIRIEERFDNWNNWEESYSIINLYDETIEEFLPSVKRFYYDNIEYTWSEELMDWKEFRHNLYNERYPQQWSTIENEWVKYKDEFSFYSPTLEHNIPSELFMEDHPTFDIVFTKGTEDMILSTSGTVASLEGNTLTLNEVGELVLTVVIPEGVNEYGITYTGRTVEIKVDVKVGSINSIDDLLPGQLLLYPNPATDVVNIASEAALISQVEIFTAAGQKVGSTTDSTINIGGLNKGIYILKIATSKGVTSKTLIVK
ncbi:T9SS type A sorting domain-containing protein [Flammeovirga sp. SJP92]|uniref:T9SS type A sorting domain-containing protein n=1 Tax=Flammeovirga sp. SJP92 TaxID=1775430 RepID=UPI000787BFF0|nr:T9SS type A sorting domain-containing protein [Flammeovirga sp. SJP92]KXX67995.1 hypothetical protein AVL50_24375 [Flammeovirga sp. SJP92]